MNKPISACVASALVSVAAVVATSSTASAQTAILNEMYGRGVHEYYAGDYREAYELLTAAIENDIQDPRAYYFRGIVARASGRPEQAEADWRTGAQLEAAGKIQGPIGRALARYQGPGRLELEEIRHQARLRALADAADRRRQRYGTPQTQPQPASPRRAPARRAPAPEAQAQQPQPQPSQSPAPVTPPPTPPAAELDNPFADDAAVEPEIQAEDALQGAVEAAQNAQSPQPATGQEGQGGEAPAAGNDPFGGDAGGGGAQDPFGAGGTDPFGGGGAGGDDSGEGAESDPFGGSGNDPFGGSGDGGESENPFG